MNLFLTRLLLVAVALTQGSSLENRPTATAEAKPSAIAQVQEQSCIANLRTINVAQNTYWSGETGRGYSQSLRHLGPEGAGLIEPVLARGEKDGYRFRLVPEQSASDRAPMHYHLLASPVRRLVKNQRSFYTDETGVIRFTTAHRAAKKGDLPVE